MKKLALLAVIVLGTVVSANAQDFSVKLGWAYAFDADEGGINLGAKYGITREIDLAGGFTFFYPGENWNYWMLDIDGHYNFPMGNGLTLYPLVGFNFTTAGYNGPGDNYSNTDFGLNLGGGAQFTIFDPLAAYIELKGIVGDASQGVLGLGLNYTFK